MSAGSIEVRTGVDADFLLDGILQDISGVECLFDLIDNAVDACRVKVGTGRTDRLGLPRSYRGTRVQVDLTEDQIAVSDNGAGVSRAELQDDVLVVGRRTKGFGLIGKYGIGLKRALLKLGDEYCFATHVDGSPYSIQFGRGQLTLDQRHSVVAHQAEKDWKLTTRVAISSLTHAGRNELAHADVQQLLVELGFRYGLLLRKGLKLRVNRFEVVDQLPKTRGADSPIATVSRPIAVESRTVTVAAETGTHADYRFSIEGKGRVRSAAEYGLYISFNDRVVRWADRSQAMGLPKSWHGEYNGFVGWLQMSGDTDELPWNSKKTDINESSDLLLSLKEELVDLSGAYRTANKALIRQAKDTNPSPPATPGGPRGGGPIDGTPPPPPRRQSKPYRFLADVRVDAYSRRVQKILEEARRLDPSRDSNLCAVVLRVLVDLCTTDFEQQVGNKRSSARDLKDRAQAVLAKIDPNKDADKDPGLIRIRHDIQSRGYLDPGTLHGFVHAPQKEPTTHDIEVMGRGWGYYISAMNSYLRQDVSGDESAR